MKRLQNRFAIVTGAGRGIGRAIAEGFAAEGALVAVNDIRAEAAQETADALGGIAVPGDVTDEAQVQQMVADTVFCRERSGGRRTHWLGRGGGT
ncbi:MAG: SDR family NAD(P)-dependent oxidoreductase [Chloroflexota bacterium]